MALIFRGESECKLCGEVLNEGQDIVATSHFIGDENDPLWKYSDSAMHRWCFLDWEMRDKFIQKFNDTVSRYTWGNRTYHHMESDGTIVSLPREIDP